MRQNISFVSAQSALSAVRLYFSFLDSWIASRSMPASLPDKAEPPTSQSAATKEGHTHSMFLIWRYNPGAAKIVVGMLQ